MNNDEIRQARELRDWYGLLAVNGNGWKVQLKSGCINGDTGPTMHNNLDEFIINPPKPKLKEINLSVCIESCIDMEFKEYSDSDDWDIVRKLTSMDANEHTTVYDSTSTGWHKCQVRQDHWHFWDGGKCPLPEGLEIMLKFRSKGRATTIGYSGYAWKHIGGSDDVIGFKVLGVADGWKYPWE